MVLGQSSVKSIISQLAASSWLVTPPGRKDVAVIFCRSWGVRRAITRENSGVAQAEDTIGVEFHVVELWTSRLRTPKCSERMYLVLYAVWTSDSRVPMGFTNNGFPVSYLTYGIFLQQTILKILTIICF